MLASAMLLAAGCNSTEPQPTAQTYPAPENRTAHRGDFVGARGPDGPVGATGAQGPVGETGAAGYAVVGPRGAAGPTGATGEQGRTGARGPAGDLAVGPAGEAGAIGRTGEQGSIGQTGVRGASADGFAGPVGPAGRTGAQGATGDTGAKGATLVGPAGPAGRAGATGSRGDVGQVGAQGSTTAGLAGGAGVAGVTGDQGATGSLGDEGPVGIVDRWTTFRDFWFEPGTVGIHKADMEKVDQIAAYMLRNPSLEVGIDASVNPRASDAGDLDLRDRRVKAIREALIQAGMPANRIVDGMLGDVDLRRNGRVEVLLRTARLTQAQ